MTRVGDKLVHQYTYHDFFQPTYHWWARPDRFSRGLGSAGTEASTLQLGSSAHMMPGLASGLDLIWT